MVTRRDYTEEAVEGALSVLVELTHLLGEYRDEIVLVGGWVPDFLFPGVDPPHVGSMDIDLALDHTKITEAGYETIATLLIDRGYEPGDHPYKFYRTIESGGGKIEVEIDLLAGEYEGTGRNLRIPEQTDHRFRYKLTTCSIPN